MMVMLIRSHSHPVDPKSYPGLLIGLFEFGMQALGTRFCHHWHAMTAALNAHPMNPKLPQNLLVPAYQTRIVLSVSPSLQGHNDYICSAVFSPDGSKIVSSADRTIRVWDVITGVQIFPPLRGHGDKLTRSLAFSLDGSKIASRSNDQTVRVWDAETGVEALPLLRGHDDWIRSVAFSPVSGSYDGTVRAWDAGTDVIMLPPLRGHSGYVTSVVFSADGSKIISKNR
jgi:WD40 repeat protein